MKLKRMLAIISVLLISLSLNVHGAEKDFQELRTEEHELRKNVTWTVEGIYQLSKARDQKLKITPGQAKKILPVFQGLVDKQIIHTEMPDSKRRERSEFGRNPDPKMQAELKKRIEFGKRELHRIDSLLTKTQVQFIDNMAFQPEKYGFINRTDFPGKLDTQFRNKGAFDGNRPDEKQIRKMREARKRLVQLNQNVLRTLKQLAMKAK